MTAHRHNRLGRNPYRTLQHIDTTNLDVTTTAHHSRLTQPPINATATEHYSIWLLQLRNVAVIEHYSTWSLPPIEDIATEQGRTDLFEICYTFNRSKHTT